MGENIIIIRDVDKSVALSAFDSFMAKINDYLNKEASIVPGKYKDCNGKQLELIVADAMRDMCVNTPFQRENINLISGQSFPDIIADKYYGVEVKSTKEDHWVSTGSSIVESTRNKDVENIYMLFGKLGGTPVQFRCKPYDLCLSDIAVTHSPRYLIDMNLQEQSKKTIFQKMNMPYDSFRLSEDSISKVRSYYYKKAQHEGRKEMPWWLNIESEASDMNVSLWTEQGSYDNMRRNNLLRAEMFILFPEILQSNFDNAALWLCVRHSIINSHIRDAFTAGGQCLELDGEKLSFRLPRIIGRLLDSSQDIVNLLTYSSSFDCDLKEFRPNICGEKRLEVWLENITCEVNNIKFKLGKSYTTIAKQGGIPIIDWILSNRKITAYSTSKRNE